MAGFQHVNIKVNPRLIEVLEAQGAQHLIGAMQGIGNEIRKEASLLMLAELDNNRPQDRRKKPINRHMLGSIRFDIVWNGRTLPIKIAVRSIADPKKAGALEFGSPAHKIKARNAPMLAFPHTGGYTGKPGRTKYKDTHKYTPLTYTKEVPHPGNREYAFIRRAIVKVMARKLPSPF